MIAAHLADEFGRLEVGRLEVVRIRFGIHGCATLDVK
jgi:hypothetical protein